MLYIKLSLKKNGEVEAGLKLVGTKLKYVKGRDSLNSIFKLIVHLIEGTNLFLTFK